MENRQNETEIQQRPQTLAEVLKSRSINLAKKEVFEEVVIILVDISGSMGEVCKNGMVKLTVVKKSIPFLFARGSYVGYGLVGFSDNASEIQNVTPDFNKIHIQACMMEAAGGTNIRKGMFLGLRIMEGKQMEKRRIILLTDGHDTYSKIDLMQAVTTCQEREVICDTISFGEGADDQLLREIAKRTGGKFTKVNSPLELEAAYKSLNYEVRYLEDKGGRKW